ncbi:MAG: oxidoreductase [Parafilimonas sp.]
MKKIVLITGATTGIGKATAIELAKANYVVYGAARRQDKLKELEQYNIKTLRMDVADDALVTQGIETILHNEGRIDVLINNAGFGSYGAIEDVPITDARYQLEVNVFGAARLMQLVLPHMRKQQYGKIVNISSIGGKLATPFGGWYHASKYALEGLSDSLRNEVKPFGIDVILIEPGGVESEWGSIAYDNLIKNSSHSVYRTMAEKFADGLKQTLHKNAKATLIARLIEKAIKAKKPKARYVAGYMATPALLAKKVLSDRMFDAAMMSQLK